MKKLLILSKIIFLFFLSNFLFAQPPAGYNQIVNRDFGFNKTGVNAVKNGTDLEKYFNWGLERKKDQMD